MCADGDTESPAVAVLSTGRNLESPERWASEYLGGGRYLDCVNRWGRTYLNYGWECGALSCLKWRKQMSTGIHSLFFVLRFLIADGM